MDARQVGTVFIRARHGVDGHLAGQQFDAPSRPSGDLSRSSRDASRSPRQILLADVPGDQPVGRTRSSPKAELGFFDSSAPNSRRHSLDDFRVLPSDGPGPQVFDGKSARLFNNPGENRFRSVSPGRGRLPMSTSRLERDSTGARSPPAVSPGIGTRSASVLLVRTPPLGASLVGEQVGVGIGLQVAANGEFFVSSIVEGTPAANASSADMIAVGDVVEAIDGVQCRGQSVARVIAMMRGAAHTPVHLDLRRKSVPPRTDAASTSILLIRLGESFQKLAPVENIFSAVLLQDLTACSGAYPERFKYMGMEDHLDEIEASIEVTEELPGLDERSSREICDEVVAQSSNNYSKLRKSPSMEHFRGIKHYLKTGTRAQQPFSTAPAPLILSKLEAAMEALKSSHRGNSLSTAGNGDPLSNYADVEISLRPIGTPASALRMNGARALQNSHEADKELVAWGGEVQTNRGITSPRDLHVSIREDPKEVLYPTMSPRHLNESTRLDQTVYGTHFDMRHVYFRFAAIIVAIIAMALLLGSKDNPIPWHCLGWTSILYAGIAPWAQFFQQYFAGGGGNPVQWIFDFVQWQQRPYEGEVPFWWLSVSTFISATLGDTLWEGTAMGYQFGSVGAFAHAIYYWGIAIMFVIIYRLRTLHPHAQSMMQLVNVCYGYEACFIFGGLVLYRILSLVWTGALTTGQLFAEYDASRGVFWGSILCGVAPLFYTLMGGIRSLYSVHPAQALLLMIFLTTTLCEIANRPNWIEGQGSWTLQGGGDLILVRLFQGSLSLPWVTAVLTDRAFLSTPATSLAAVLVGTLLAYCFSFMSSLLGVYARYAGIAGTVLDVGKYLGGAYYHLVALMIITNTMGTIDSCLVSASKLGGLEAFALLAGRSSDEIVTHPLGPRSARFNRTNVLVGRIALMVVGGVGLCCLATEVNRPGSIAAARLSGIMTMGISPPMILMCAWRRNWKRCPTAFWLPIAVSIITGILVAVGTNCIAWDGTQCAGKQVNFNPNWKLGNGDYAYELGLTVFSFLIAGLACVTGFLLDQQFRFPDTPEEPNIVYRYAEKLAEKDGALL